ncbi:MAG: LysR family transcriptional regulator [Nitrospirae bacterium]|jgi:DNA-binding transcriptional LysR family regulator|nr:LysR family transcriptional regulator [Nitrospirota bacterium]
MDIHHLRVFASVFKNKSFSKASEELYLTQPTISNHIKALEDELECNLFDRLGRTIIPTKEAEVLYNLSTELIEKVINIKETIANIKKDVSGKLLIGASSIPGVYLIPRIIAGFKKNHPAISFQIIISDSMEISERISGHDLLMGIVGAKLGNEDIVYIPFVEDELIAVSAPNFVKKKILTLKELVQYPMVLREDGSGTRKVTEKFFMEKEISLDDIQIAGLFGSTDSIKQAVKAGLGVSILSKFSVSEELVHGTLEEIKLSDIKMRRKFYIATHRKRTLPRLYAAFLEHLIRINSDRIDVQD